MKDKIFSNLLPIAIMLASLIFSFSYYSTNKQSGRIFVLGTASDKKMSDVAKLNINLNKSCGLDNKNQTSDYIKKSIGILVNKLEAQGFEKSKINIYTINGNSRYSNGSEIGYEYYQRISVSSEDIDKIEGLSDKIASMLPQDISVNANIEYFIDMEKIKDIKYKLVQKATEDAKKRAQIMAKGSNTSVGKLISLRTGIFQITEPLSVDVSDYGIYSTETREKKITITVNADFALN